MKYCHSVLVTGLPQGLPMYHRMGIYKLLPFTHNSKPAYRINNPDFGAAYMYWESMTKTENYWVISPQLGSKDVNLGVDDPASSPDKVSIYPQPPARLMLPSLQISTPWHVADMSRGTFDTDTAISTSCSTEGGTSASAAPACKTVEIYGQPAGGQMYNRMGDYHLMTGSSDFYKRAGKPIYRLAGGKNGEGDAYLYYEFLTPTEQYWVVGEKIGSREANLGVPDKAATPDKVPILPFATAMAISTF
jgi:hypothetical protein